MLTTKRLPYFSFTGPPPPQISTLSLHALFRSRRQRRQGDGQREGRLPQGGRALPRDAGPRQDRKSTRLNSSHTVISYAVFCLKKKRATGPTYRRGTRPPPTRPGRTRPAMYTRQ